MEVTNLKPAIGSEVRIDRQALIDGTHADEIRELLARRGVLVFRDMHLSNDEQRAFTSTIGKIRYDEVRKEEMIKVKGYVGPFFWHMDGTYDAVPPFATVLCPHVLDPNGGNTEFANTYAAFANLPAEEQEQLSTLQAVHTMESSMFRAYRKVTVEQMASWLSYPTRTHPLVWQHENGRKSLVMGSSCAHVVDMHLADSHELLQKLLAHATSEPNVYSHKWRMGDVVMWDNTGTMHRARPYDESTGRELHRFTIEGHEPITAASGQAATGELHAALP